MTNEFELLDELAACAKDKHYPIYRIAMYKDGRLEERELIPAPECIALYSVSKNYITAGCGMAIDEGFLTYDTTVWDLFRAEKPYLDERWKCVTLETVLSQTTGCGGMFLDIDCDDAFSWGESDWLDAVLKKPFIHEPNTVFDYTDSNFYIASRMLAEATGKRANEYLSHRLFEKMKNGEVEEGKMTLRAKIDLASGNFNMRDPVIYRIRFINHHRQGTKWCIFPMYDFAHPIQDALEGITHSLCSLEYEEHRPLYDWVVNNVSIPYHKPRQIEFARLNIDHTVMSKRKLRKLVEEHYVSGWDDPRMPTLCGLRRRGYTAASIRNFCEMIGVGKTPSVIEYGTLEHCLREDLNATAERTMAVLHPVKLTVTNYPEGKSEVFTVENNPTDPAQGTHDITFSRHLWIEAEDFMEVPVPKYKRLTPNGPECRLKGAYLVQCTGCVKDADGNVTEVLCTYDPESSGGDPADGRKVKGATLHWVDAENCMDAEVRLYDNLFSDEQPDGPDKDFLDCLNPESLTVLTGCKVEPEMRKVAEAFDKQADRTGVNAPTFQFMRVGYFCLDNRDSSAAHMVFNRSVSLKDSFKK